jgi:hypothetical protein
MSLTGEQRGLQVTNKQAFSENSAPVSKPVRLRPALYEAAMRQADIEHRSIAKQVDYWAEVGRWVTERTQPHRIYALLAGTAELKIEEKPSVPVSPANVLDDLAAAQDADTFALHIGEHEVIYDVAPGRPELIRRTDNDGTETFGTFVEGEFVVSNTPEQ